MLDRSHATSTFAAAQPALLRFFRRVGLTERPTFRRCSILVRFCLGLYHRLLILPDVIVADLELWGRDLILLLNSQGLFLSEACGALIVWHTVHFLMPRVDILRVDGRPLLVSCSSGVLLFRGNKCTRRLTRCIDSVDAHYWWLV